MKIKFSQFWYKLKAIFEILFTKDSHWIIINIDYDNVLKNLNGKPFDVSMTFIKLQEYNAFSIIRGLNTYKDEIHMMVMKAQFEADAEYYYKNKN